MRCSIPAAFLFLPLILAQVVSAQDSTPTQEELSRVGSDGTPTFGTNVVVPSGLQGRIYKISSDTWMLPDFSKKEPIGTIWTSTLDVKPRHFTEGFPGVTKRFEWFAIDYSGRFWIEHPGDYRFALMSDDGSKLFIDGKLLIDNDCQHPPVIRASGVPMEGGIHTIRVLYFQGPRDCLALMLAVAAPGEQWRVFSTDEFKPPRDTDEWKYGDARALNTAPDPDATRTKLRDAVKNAPPEEKVIEVHRDANSTAGCIVTPPVIHCAPPPISRRKTIDSDRGEPNMQPNSSGGTLQPNSAPH